MKKIFTITFSILLLSSVSGQNLLSSKFSKKLFQTKTASLTLDAKTLEEEKPLKIFEASPAFNFITNNNNNLYVPNFDILLTNLKTDGNSTTSFKIFTGAASIDTTFSNNATRLIIPEVSRLGVKINYLYAINENNSFNLDINFLNKDFANKKDTNNITSFNSWIIHGKLGFEKILVKDLISFYGNVNMVYKLTNIDEMKSLFGSNNNEYLFLDFGLRLMKSISSNANEPKSDFIVFDIGFIPVNGAIFKLYNNTNENVIPSIRIGYTKLINN